jgi:predicted nucleic acid-binding protein
LRDLLATNSVVVVLRSHLLRIELRSALARRVREGTVAQKEYRRMLELFAEDCAALYRFVPLIEAMIQQAGEPVDRYPLRGYDPTHLATALAVNQQLAEAGEASLIFLSADDRLLEAASAEGMPVENPHHHL